MDILVFLPTGKNAVVAGKFMAHVIVICVWRGAKPAETYRTRMWALWAFFPLRTQFHYHTIIKKKKKETDFCFGHKCPFPSSLFPRFTPSTPSKRIKKAHKY